MFWFGKKYQKVKITIRPLHGIGSNRKEALKFIKKYLRKSGNFNQVYMDIETAKKVVGSMFIFGELPTRLAKKLYRRQEKIGIEVELLEEFLILERRMKKMLNVSKHYMEKKQPWVYSTY